MSVTTPYPVGSVAQRAYNALEPMCAREKDLGWPLLAYMAALALPIQPVADLAETGPNGEPGWSAVLDIDRIPDEGLPWLAQLVGLRVASNITSDQLRSLIRLTPNWKRGTPQAMIDAIKPFLTGTKLVNLKERSDPDNEGIDMPYDLTVQTKAGESDDQENIMAAILSQKPAGLTLHYVVIAGQTFQHLMDFHPTFQRVYADYADFEKVYLDEPNTGGGPSIEQLFPSVMSANAVVTGNIRLRARIKSGSITASSSIIGSLIKGVLLGGSLPPRITLANPVITYYVDASIGLDTRTAVQAQTITTPWKTLQHALDNVPKPGANTPVRIYVRGTDGTTTRGFTITDTGPGSAVPTGYTTSNNWADTTNNSDLNFSPSSPLIISNYPGERVLLSFKLYFSYISSYIAIRATRVSGKKGIVIDTRFPSGATGESPLSFVGAVSCEVYGVEIRNACWNGTGGGIYVGGYSASLGTRKATDIQIWNCYVHHCGGAVQGAHGIYYGGTFGTAKGATGGVIANCLFAWNSDDNISPHNSNDGLIVTCCTAVGYGGGGTAGGGVSSTPLTGSGITRAFNNGITFFSNTPTDPASVNMRICNNILADNRVYGLNDYDNALNSTNREHNNLYFGNGTGNRRATAGMLLQSTLTANDPKFTSWSPTNAASDLHPLTSSPARGAGDPNFTPTFDFDDQPRLRADIGAYAIP